MMKQSRFPKGWDEDLVKRILDHYENQTEDEAVAEDEAAWEDTSHTYEGLPKLDCAQIVPVKVKYFQIFPNETKS